MSEVTKLPLNALRAFEAVAAHLSFTGAAHALNVTTAACAVLNPNDCRLLFTVSAPMSTVRIAPAAPEHLPLILSLIRELAEFERLLDQVTASEEQLHASLFGPRPYAEVVIAWVGQEAAGFALFFHNYSTFLAKPGIYLEDLYVRPPFRGGGCGKALLRHLAQLAVQRGCGRLEWSVLDWNQRAIHFYASLGAKPLDEWTMYRVTGDALQKLAE